jgi:hypothetical protein
MSKGCREEIIDIILDFTIGDKKNQKYMADAYIITLETLLLEVFVTILLC